MSQKPMSSSTGGTITYTKTGLVHTAKSGAYSGALNVASKAVKTTPGVAEMLKRQG